MMPDIQRYTIQRSAKRYIALACLVLLLGPTLIGCGDDLSQREARLNVEVVGWGPGANGNLGFHTSLPNFLGAEQVRVSLTKPATGDVLSSKIFLAGQRNAILPELQYGVGLRLEFDLLDGSMTPLATGATPLFDFGEDEVIQSFRIQVDKTNDFAPVGAIFSGELTQTSFDRRAIRAMGLERWLGRIGHATVLFDGGNRALVVGGATTEGQTFRAGVEQEFDIVHDDLMEFTPADGYFTDLSYNPETGSVFPNGGDRLDVARAFHTLTPIGDDKFLVIGGLTKGDSAPTPTASIALVDMKAEPGARVKPLLDGAGMPLALNLPRAFHTATYRPADNSVVVAGGIGDDGPNNALKSTEIIQLDTLTVVPGPLLTTPRADHQAVLMGDGETIWILGGRDSDGALSSTDRLSLTPNGTSVSADARMATPRYDFEAIRVSPLDGTVVIVIGGYTDLDGNVADTYELSTIGRDNFLSMGNWTLTTGRGNPQAIELPNTHNIVVLGGRDENRVRVGAAEVLVLNGLTADVPYTAKATGTSSYNDRADATAVLLANGKILLAGGVGDSGTTIASAEYFTPQDPRPQAATPTP
jgi:hypothetical protein